MLNEPLSTRPVRAGVRGALAVIWPSAVYYFSFAHRNNVFVAFQPVIFRSSVFFWSSFENHLTLLPIYPCRKSRIFDRCSFSRSSASHTGWYL